MSGRSARSGSNFNRRASRGGTASDFGYIRGLEESAIFDRSRGVSQRAESAMHHFQAAVNRSMNRIIQARSKVGEHRRAARRSDKLAAIAFAARTARRSV